MSQPHANKVEFLAHYCITFRFLGHNLESSLKTIIEPLTFDLDTNYRLEFEKEELPYTYNLVASKEFQIKQKANVVNREKWAISNWLKLIVQKYLKKFEIQAFDHRGSFLNWIFFC